MKTSIRISYKGVQSEVLTFRHSSNINKLDICRMAKNNIYRPYYKVSIVFEKSKEVHPITEIADVVNRIYLTKPAMREVKRTTYEKLHRFFFKPYRIDYSEMYDISFIHKDSPYIEDYMDSVLDLFPNVRYAQSNTFYVKGRLCYIKEGREYILCKEHTTVNRILVNVIL